VHETTAQKAIHKPPIVSRQGPQGSPVLRFSGQILQRYYMLQWEKQLSRVSCKWIFKRSDNRKSIPWKKKKKLARKARQR